MSRRRGANRRAAFVGRILTMDPARPTAQAAVIDGDRIIAVGTRDVLREHPGAAVQDLGPKTLVPGFIDAHHHLSIAALHPRWADLSDVRTLDGMAETLREQAAREPAARWVRAFGWDEFVTGLRPTRADLDAVGLDRPVILAHFTLHRALVCSRGLDELGIDAATPDPSGGTIERDRRGRPTGVLVERAWSAAHARSLAVYAEPDRWAEHITIRGEALLRDGITCVHDAACSPMAEAVYATMRRDRTLPLSVLVMPHSAELLRNEVGDRLDGAVTGEGDEWLQVGPIKLFADGGDIPAIDVHFGDKHVVMGSRFEDVETTAHAAASRGFRIAVHAMGNVGVRSAIDAFRAVARERDDDHRFRIEHIGMAGAAALADLASLGAVGVVQPGFVDHIGEAASTFTPDDARWLPFASAAAAGIMLAGSSDDPCAPSAPLRTSAFGATRVTHGGKAFGTDEALPYLEWLRAYTTGAAFAGGQEHERGSITPGRRADLVVLDGALEAATPPRVAETWVAGALAFAADPPG